LGFEEDPDYNYLRDLFKKIMDRNNDQFDFMFDWVKKQTIDNISKLLFAYILKKFIFPINLF
jgi:hypothetical protein